MPFDLSDPVAVFAALAAVVLLLALLRRVPVIGRLVSVALWVGCLALAASLLVERERFDPYLGRIAKALKLHDEQTVVGGVTRIPLSRDGHFWVRATIGGVERRMLVDSGATVTALSVRTAAAAGVTKTRTPFPMLIRTANGTVAAETGTVGELRMGNIVARDLAVVVSPAFGNADVLGMNFLSRLKGWRVEEGTMVLVPHHPQDTAEG